MPCSHPFGPLRAAIVDLDGTMVDTLGDFVVALNEAFAELSLPALEPSAVGRMVGKGSELLIRSALAHVGGDYALHDVAERAYQRHYKAVNGRRSVVYPGVLQGLGALRVAGLKLACVTNKPAAFAQPLLQSNGLAGFFDAVFGGDAFEHKKPDPLPLRMACQALGSTPAHTLVIGDSSNDAQAARAAGCPVLLVTYGYNHAQPVRSVDADGFLDSLADVAAWLAGVKPPCPASRP